MQRLDTIYAPFLPMIFDLALMTLNQIHDKSLGRKQSLCKVETFDVFFFFFTKDIYLEHKLYMEF